MQSTDDQERLTQERLMFKTEMMRALSCRTKKQKIKLFSYGIIENVSRREARKVSKKSGSGLGAVIGLGLAALLIGAALSDDKKG